MSKFNFYAGLLSAKILSGVLKTISNSRGTALPGKIALDICPKFVSYAEKFCNKKIINVTGTNGKTTTSGLLTHILRTNKNTVLNNSKGANMLTGITTELAQDINLFKKNDYYVLETDEAYLTKLYDFMKGDYLIITNLFHDQTDRYGTINALAEKIQDAINKNPELKIVMNADDPMLITLAKNNEKIYFGFDEIEIMTKNKDIMFDNEDINCECSKPLKYLKRFYSHIGHYYCDCGFSRPKPNYKATAKIYEDFSQIQIENKIFTVYLPGIYNAYNALAAISVAMEFGIDKNIIQKALDTYQAAFGRAERCKMKGKSVLIQLIKNPVGATEVLRTVSEHENANLLIMINDNFADGRDMSWFWDTNFELLQHFKGKIFLGGIRRYDIANRLKYADIPKEQMYIEEDTKTIINKALDETKQDETLIILPSYTILLKMQKMKF